MAKEELTVSLDFGSGFVHGVLAQYNEEENKVAVVSADSMASDGVKDGVVIAIPEASKTVEQLIKKLQKDNEAKVGKIIASVRGSLIEVFNSDAEVKMPENDTEVREDTIQDIMEKIEDIKRIGDNQEIIDIIPIEYILDDQGGIQSPIGMKCKYLDLHALVVVATKTNMENIRSSVDDDNLQLHYGYSSIGDMLVSKEDKELGSILIDIGGMTTGVVVYLDGKIKYAFELQMGSDYITRDIVKKLRVSQREAKKIKENYGVVLEELITENEEFEYTIAGVKQQTCTKMQLTEIIKPQVDLQIDQIYKALKKKNIEIDMLAGGIILTGGGSMMQGMVDAFEKAFSCVTKVANFNEDEIIADRKLLHSHTYTTAIATLLNEYKNRIFTNKNKSGKNSSLFSRVKKFINGSI